MRRQWDNVQEGCFIYIYINIFLTKEKESNAMAKNLTVTPGYGRIEMLWRSVKGVLGAGMEPRAKPRLAAWADFLC